MSKAVSCPACGESNRIDYAGGAPERCAACGARLDSQPFHLHRSTGSPSGDAPVRTRRQPRTDTHRAPRGEWLASLGGSNGRLAAICGVAAVAAFIVAAWLTRARTATSSSDAPPAPVATAVPSNPPAASPAASSQPTAETGDRNEFGAEARRRQMEARNRALPSPASRRAAAPVVPPAPPLPDPITDAVEVDATSLADFDAAQKTIKDAIGMELVLLPPAKLTYRKAYPSPASGVRSLVQNSTVLIPRPFYMGIREVTREQFLRVMGYDPSPFLGEGLPISNVSWYEAIEFCRRLSALENATYRLPSDAEWEHASRDASIPTAHFASAAPVAVGSYAPTGRGLHDLLGNVAEWCCEPCVDSVGVRHSARGGCFSDAEAAVTPTHRLWQTGRSPTVGFRVVREFDRIRNHDSRVARPEQRAQRLIARLEAALAAPRQTPAHPRVLVFPATGSSSARNYSTAVLAQWFAVYPTPGTAEKTMDISPEAVRRLYALDAMFDERYKLDPATRDACLAYTGAKMYAIPRFRRDPLAQRGRTDWLIEVTCHGDGEKYPDRTFTHQLSGERIGEAAGLIALDVFEFLGIPATPEQRDKVTRFSGEVQQEQDDLSFRRGSFEPSERNTYPETEYVVKARHLPHVWSAYLTAGSCLADTLHRPGLLAAARQLGGVEVALARHLCLIGRPDEAADLLLALVPTHRGDPIFHETLVRYAMEVEGQRVVERFFDLWRDEDPTYSGLLGRGELLLEWAESPLQDDRQSIGDAAPPPHPERLRAARSELEQAAAANPLDWRAHSLLIGVARKSGLPTKYALRHFSAAIRHDRAVRAYRELYEYLKCHGDDRQLLVFGKLCAESNLPRQGVPAILEEIVRVGALDGNGTPRPEYLRLPELHDALRAYFDHGMFYSPHVNRIGNFCSHWNALRGNPGGVTPPLAPDAREVWRVPSEGRTVTALALSPSHEELLVARMGGVLSAHDAATGARNHVYTVRPDHSDPERPPLMTEPYAALSVTPDGRIAAASVRGNVLTWEWGAASAAAEQSSGNSGAVSALVWLPGRESFLCAAWGGLTHEDGLYEVVPGRERGSLGFEKFSARLASLALSPDGTVVLTGDDDGAAHLLAMGDRRELHRLDGHAGTVGAVAFSPDGTLVASAADRDPIIRLWDAATGSLVRELTGHESGVLTVAFSPDGKRLLSGSGFRNPDGPFSTKPRDNSLRLWDIASGRELLKLNGHGDDVTCLTFLADGKQAASGSRDGTVRLWNVDLTSRLKPP